MALTLTIELSPDVESQLRAETPDLDATAKEGFLVALYRRGKISHHAMAQSLGLNRFELEDLLHRHNVTEDLGTLAEYEADIEVLRKLRGANR
ncbi:MAG TPA: UPF0175 family protein [Tepidisphaeraceae bacterium]|jgi:predicted HTH domain antitoxin